MGPVKRSEAPAVVSGSTPSFLKRPGGAGEQAAAAGEANQPAAKKARKQKHAPGGRQDGVPDLDHAMQVALEILFKFGEAFRSTVPQALSEKAYEDCVKTHAKSCGGRGLMYSHAKTVNTVASRILYAATLMTADLPEDDGATGLALWYHGWRDDRPRCYHGELMLKKENTIEMSPTSEAGLAALKEGRGTMVQSNFGKQMVRVVQPNCLICAEDAKQWRMNNYGPHSCGLSFTDSAKAVVALKQARAFTEAVFPQASVEHVLFIPVCCECNYGKQSTLGRQLPKMTPYQIAGVDQLDLASTALDAAQTASAMYPCMFVYQCCNVTNGRRPAGAPAPAKSCDFKISQADLLYALVLARSMWKIVFGAPIPIKFPRFVWGPRYAVKTAVLPQLEVDRETDDPFGPVEPPPSSAEQAESEEEQSDED